MERRSSGDKGTWLKASATSVPEKLAWPRPKSRRQWTASSTTSASLGRTMRSPCRIRPSTSRLR
eukprot:5119064-Alexandrium_andersonii.AAC.1